MTLDELVTKLAGRRFLVIGRVGMDLSPDPPGTATVDATHMVVGMGGSSANIAAGLVKLGCEASLVTRVSDDAIGRYCVAQLEAYGVGHEHVRPVGGEHRNSIAIYESRVEDHQTVIYRNGAADFAMDESDIETVDWDRYDAVVTAGTVFAAEPSRSASFLAFERARSAGLPVIFDIDYRPYSWPTAQVAEEVLSRAGAMADVIVGNDEEFGFMAGHVDRGLAKAEGLAKEGAAVVVYKMGPQGAITFAGGERLETGIYPVEALKPTGAGDSFMAGLLAGLAEGRPLRESVLRGSACASIVVAKPGCAPAMPVTQALDAFLQDREPTGG